MSAIFYLLSYNKQFLNAIIDEFYNWINPQYLDPMTQSEIQTQFETNSEISLPNFLHPEKYCMIKAAFKEISETSKMWKNIGPANKRNIDILSKEDSIESNDCQKIVRSCMDFLSSDAVFLLLSNLTGLNLHPMAMVDSDDDSDKEIKDENTENGIQDSKNMDKNIKVKSSTSSIKATNYENSTMKCHSKCRPSARRWRQVNNNTNILKII